MEKFSAVYIFLVFVLVQRVSSSPETSSENARVVGGSEANQGQFPYQVSLKMLTFGGYSHFCGGSILNEYWVLTAAHCVFGIPPIFFKVDAGDHNIRANHEAEQRRKASFVVVHERYSRSKIQNDIALIRVNSPFVFDEYVQPIGIEESGPKAGTTCVVSGWGSTSTSEEVKIPEVLHYAPVPAIDTQTCQYLWANSSKVTDKQVCTGPLEGGPSACVGDSGGPLACGGHVAGIVSYGQVPCGQRNTPAVFTRVAAYKDWIRRYTDGPAMSFSHRNDTGLEETYFY